MQETLTENVRTTKIRACFWLWIYWWNKTFCANLLFNKCEAICILIDICFFFFFNSSSLWLTEFSVNCVSSRSFKREREKGKEKDLFHLNLVKRKRHGSSLVQGGSKQTTLWNGGIEMAESLGDCNALMHTMKEQFRSFAHATSWSNVLCSR